MNYDNQIRSMAKMVMEALKERGVKMATAESLTGGMVASSIIYHPGSSEVIDGGVVAYQDRVKAEILNVPKKILDDPQFSAVSPQCVKAMCQGLLKMFPETTYAVATSGYAGPTGAEVGKVYIAVMERGKAEDYSVSVFNFSGDRDMVRKQATLTALIRLYEQLMV